MKFDERGHPTFNDEQDRAAYRLLLSSIKKSGKLFTMTIGIYEPANITENQKKLYRVVIDLIAMESGNDIKSIEETILSNFSREKIILEDMNNDTFNNFLNFTITFGNDFFNMNITQNENGNFEINKIR